LNTAQNIIFLDHQDNHHNSYTVYRRGGIKYTGFTKCTLKLRNYTHTLDIRLTAKNTDNDNSNLTTATHHIYIHGSTIILPVNLYFCGRMSFLAMARKITPPVFNH